MPRLKASSVGSRADIQANVNIEKVHGGYFSSKKNADAFVEEGLAFVEQDLPQKIKFGDFGGGTGFLTQVIKDYLKKKGHRVEAIVVDANQKYLDVAKSRGLKTRKMNIEQFKGKDFDLITMRAVTHYNEPKQLKKLLKNVFKGLRCGGFLITQLSSGNKENCELRSKIVNLKSLGRAGAGKYKWTTGEEYGGLLHEAGFSEYEIVGYAPPCSWGPEEQWERFNNERLRSAKALGEKKKVAQILKEKNVYLKEAKKLIERYAKKDLMEEIGIEKDKKGRYKIHYVYPLIIAKKC